MTATPEERLASLVRHFARDLRHRYMSADGVIDTDAITRAVVERLHTVGDEEVFAMLRGQLYDRQVAHIAPVARAGGLAAIRRRVQACHTAYARSGAGDARAEWQFWSTILGCCERAGYDDDTPPDVLADAILADTNGGERIAR
jgi:hypothetical protein